jgi:thioredoxin reductase
MGPCAIEGYDDMPVTTIAYETDNLPDETVDAVVIGGGAAGLSGALMLARSRRSVVVIDGGSPRNAPAAGVHGLLGHDGVPPAELLQAGRDEVRRYGGLVVAGDVISAAATAASAEGDLRFTVSLGDGSAVRARRLLVATGLRDVLPEIPGLARHWGHRVVHCPYCHGWEVRDEPIGVLAVGPASVHQALLFRQLTDDLVYFSDGTELDEETRARFAARGIQVIDTSVDAVESAADGNIAGVRLSDGRLVARRVLAVATSMQARTGHRRHRRRPGRTPCWPGKLPSSDLNQSMSSSRVTWKPSGTIAASLAASSAAKPLGSTSMSPIVPHPAPVGPLLFRGGASGDVRR